MKTVIRISQLYKKLADIQKALFFWPSVLSSAPNFLGFTVSLRPRKSEPWRSPLKLSPFEPAGLSVVIKVIIVVVLIVIIVAIIVVRIEIVVAIIVGYDSRSLRPHQREAFLAQNEIALLV